MNVGVIADTHDDVAAVERATDLFAEAGVEVVAPPVLQSFDGFELHGVLGNKDIIY